MDCIFDNDRPIYIQLVEQLRIEIISGKLAAGERIPSVRELALITKVNPNTMQKALVELEGKPFKYFEAHRDVWAVETAYTYPGAIQYYGPTEVCDLTTRTLALEKE